MVIRLKDLVPGADTASEGTQLFEALVECLKSSSSVSVSFDGISTTTASFTNASFLRLAQEKGLAVLKERVKIHGASNQVRDMLRERVIRSTSLSAEAV